MKCATVECAEAPQSHLRYIFAGQEPLSGTLLHVHDLGFDLDTMTRAWAEQVG